jgi:DNA processing protein
MLDMPTDVQMRSTFISATDPRFPARFSDLAVPPRALWVTGVAPAETLGLVAMVGSRAASRRAAARTFDLAAALAAAGWGVISGGALGIDAAAHRGALAARGATFAVLGCGIDIVYPDRHAGLFDEISAGGGGLLSEYGPGTPPRPGQFPARNRLVAALARVVVVGEARGGSGALITARLARTLGRPLLAIPGSAGTDALLAAGGALAVETTRDIMNALAGRPPAAPRTVPAAFQALVQALQDGPAGAEAIALRMGMSLPQTLGVLSEAELRGLVLRTAGAKFEAVKSRFEASRGH